MTGELFEQVGTPIWTERTTYFGTTRFARQGARYWFHCYLNCHSKPVVNVVMWDLMEDNHKGYDAEYVLFLN